MKKIKTLISLGLFGGLAVASIAATKFDVSTVKNYFAPVTVDCSNTKSWYDKYDNIDDYIVSEEKADSTKYVREYSHFTDEEYVDTLYGTNYKGRWVNVDYVTYDSETDSELSRTTKREGRVPSNIARKTTKSYVYGEKNPNEWDDSLQSFLKAYINSETGSYESFCSYIDYLVKDFGMYEEEAESYRYDWRYAHNTLTDEEKQAIQDAEDEEKKRQEELEKENQEIADKIYDITHSNSSDESKNSLYVREANMIERSVPDYANFDREKFIAYRESGLSYTEAYNKSIDIDYAKGFESIAGSMKEHGDWYKKMFDTFTSDSFQETFQKIADDLGNFFGELFGLSDSDTNSDTTTSGESD